MMSELIVGEKETVQLVHEGLKHAISYADYVVLMKQLVSDGKSTGDEQTEVLSNYTMLNERRMARLDKTLKIDEASSEAIKKFEKKATWLVLTESWCGDAAQSMPLMNKIVELNANISLKIILRDEHLDLMNWFLYNGTLSIPKLIMIENQNGKVIGEWGPRPFKATKMAEDFKLAKGKLTAEFKQNLQVWYNKDKGQDTLKDLMGLLLK